MLASKYDYGQFSMVQNIADKVTEPCWDIKNCQFFAAICRKLLATANSLPQFAGNFWQLPILCRNLQEAFGSCQFFAAICMKVLTVSDAVDAISGARNTPSECGPDVLSNPRTFAPEPASLVFRNLCYLCRMKIKIKEYAHCRYNSSIQNNCGRCSEWTACRITYCQMV